MSRNNDNDSVHLERIHYIAGLVAAIFLVIALLLHINFDNYLGKMNADEIKAALGKNPLSTAYFWSSLLKEIAFALIIAIFIAIGIEKAAKYKQVEEVKSYLDEVKSNVFDATLKRQFPPALVDKVLSSILSSDTIRKNSRMTIKLKDFPGECTDGKDCLVYEVIHHYRVKNITDKKILHPVSLFGPAPRKSTLRTHLPKMTIMIENNELSDQVISEGTAAIDNNGFEERFKTEWEIEPGKAINIRTSVAFDKLSEDAEMWVSLLPHVSFDLTIEIESKKDLLWDLDCLFFGDLECTTPGLDSAPYSARRGTFTTSDIILPYQGINFSWRTM